MIGTFLKEQGWRLEMLGASHYRFNKGTYQFEVRYADERVFVTVPLPGSDSRYRVRLDSLDEVDPYLSAHLDNFNDKFEAESYETVEWKMTTVDSHDSHW